MIPIAKISIPAVSVLAFLAAGWQAPNYFVTTQAAQEQHQAITHEIRRIYLELRISSANSELAFIENAGIATDQQRRHYDLLIYSVKEMTAKLLEIEP